MQMPVKIDIELYNKLKEIRKKDGVSIAESLRRALNSYIKKGVK